MKSEEELIALVNEDLSNRHAPLIVLEGTTLTPYAMCVPIIFPYTPAAVGTQDWFIDVFCDCYEEVRTEEAGIIVEHANNLLAAVKLRENEARYRHSVNASFEDLEDPFSLKHTSEIVRVLEHIATIAASHKGICRWHARRNTEKIGPRSMPWLIQYLPPRPRRR